MTVNVTCGFDDVGLNLARVLIGQLERDEAKLRGDISVWTAEAIIARAVKETKMLDAIYRGSMISSWRITKEADGVTFGNLAPWAKAIEYGRLPGPVNQADIIEWTRVKLFGLPPRHDRSRLRSSPGAGALRPSVRLRVKRVGASRTERAAMKANRNANVSDLEAEAYRAGVAIAASIEKKGTEPRFILRTAMKVGPRAFRALAKKNLPTVDVPF